MRLPLTNTRVSFKRNGALYDSGCSRLERLPNGQNTLAVYARGGGADTVLFSLCFRCTCHNDVQIARYGVTQKYIENPLSMWPALPRLLRGRPSVAEMPLYTYHNEKPKNQGALLKFALAPKSLHSWSHGANHELLELSKPWSSAKLQKYSWTPLTVVACYHRTGD